MLVSVLVPGADVRVGSVGVGVDAAAWGVGLVSELSLVVVLVLWVMLAVFLWWW